MISILLNYLISLGRLSPYPGRGYSVRKANHVQLQFYGYGQHDNCCHRSSLEVLYTHHKHHPVFSRAYRSLVSLCHSALLGVALFLMVRKNCETSLCGRQNTSSARLGGQVSLENILFSLLYGILYTFYVLESAFQVFCKFYKQIYALFHRRLSEMRSASFFLSNLYKCKTYYQYTTDIVYCKPGIWASATGAARVTEV